MANVGSLVVDLALQSAQFIAGLKQAQAATTQTATHISTAMNTAKSAAVGLASGFIGAFSFDLIQQRIQEAFDFGDAIVDLSDKTGATTKSIQEFRYAAQLSGSSVESADAAIEKFSKNLGSAINGNQAMAKTFKDLGVTSTDTDTAMRQTMDGISKLGNVTARNQKTIELFGKSAGDLTVLMSGGSKGFDTLAEAARGYGIVLDDEVLRNGGKFNDQVDTMKMILNAQMANGIIQNVDAIMALANSFTQATTAAANFFATMSTNRLMSVANGVGINSDMPSVIAGRLQGKSFDQISSDARDELKTTKAGRSALHSDLTKRYNDGIRAGRNKNDADMQAILAEREDIAKAEVRSRVGLKTSPPAGGGTLPTPKVKPTKTKTGPTLKTDDELSAEWERAWLGAKSDLYRAQSALTTDPTERQDLEAKQLRNRYFTNDADITSNTGTDQQVREGKKRYSEAQAKLLRQIENEIFDAEYDATINDRQADIAKDRLQLSLNGLQIDNDILSSELALSRSTKDRKDKALAMVRNQFEQERLQLEHTIELEKLGKATKAEREAAEARLKALPALKALAEAGVTRQNQTPLESYLDAIPSTSAEINDQLESIQVEGLQKLQDGLMGVIDGTKSVGEAFGSMAKGIINDLIKIGIQQAIIKPLAGLLFGGGEGGGGGFLGSILGSVFKGARANTALACRLDFKSGSVFVWTGMHPIQPTGSGDSLLDGNIFDPLAYGVVVDIGENTFSMNGSDELPITLNVPSSPDITIAAAQTYPNEYQSRSAVVWRAIRIDTGNPLAQPVWAFRRIRAGTMDKVEVQADGTSHKFILTIESHVGRITNASNQTYLNQRSYDPNDSSQDFAASIANGDVAPTKASTGSSGGYGAGYPLD